MVKEKRMYTAEAAEKIGISRATLLRWFAQGKIAEVARDVRGWRVYTEEDIDRISNYANRIDAPEVTRSQR